MIVTNRIKLPLLSENDVTDEYISWHQNTDHVSLYSSSGKVFNRENLVSEIREGKRKKTLFIHGIHHSLDNKLIGNIKIGPINYKHKTSDLVVFIGNTNYLGKGYAVEAIRAGNELAFSKYGIRKLFGGMYSNNKKAVNAYLKAGWVIEGIQTGHYLFDNDVQDRIFVACFNPKYFNIETIKHKFLNFEDIYDF